MDNAATNQNRYSAKEYYKTAETIAERTELRGGVIVAMARPSRLHQRISSRLHHAIDRFITANHGDCEVDEAIDVELGEDTVVVPDLAVICDPSKLNDHGCIGAPDWTIEILSTNRHDDLHDKLRLYQDAGVREYWIVDPKNEKTLVYFFERNDLPDIYTFDTPIPVEIYNRRLAIRIADFI